MKKVASFSIFLLYIINAGSAQLPSAGGTTWEYVNFWGSLAPFNKISAFTDQVVGDTTINSVLYHQVKRVGQIIPYDFMMGLPSKDSLRLTGVWHFRNAGDTVFFLDSVAGNQNLERILFDFSQIPGDTTQHLPMSIIEATTANNRHDAGFICGICISYTNIVDSTNTLWGGTAYHYDMLQGLSHNWWKNGIGQVYGSPLFFIPEYVGEEFFLWKLTSNGNVLYEFDLEAVGFSPKPERVPKSIYPNPALDRVFIQDDFALREIKLIDISGRTLLHKKIPGSTQGEVSLQGIPSGIFFLEIITENGKSRQKLVIQ